MNDASKLPPEVVSAEWDRVYSWTDPALARLAEPPKSEMDRRNKERVRENLRVSAPLVEQLRERGVPLKTLGDLGNVRLRYPAIVPLLLEHLDHDYPDDIYGSLFAASTARYGPMVFRRLYRFLVEDADRISDRTQYTLANAIAENAAKGDIDQLLTIVWEKRFGAARYPIMKKIAKWHDPRISDAFLSYFRERSHDWGGVNALRLAKVWSAVDEVRPLLESENPEVRKEVRAFLKAADR